MNERCWSDGDDGELVDQYGAGSGGGCGPRHHRPAMTDDDFCKTRIVVDEHEPDIGTSIRIMNYSSFPAVYVDCKLSGYSHSQAVSTQFRLCQ